MINHYSRTAILQSFILYAYIIRLIYLETVKVFICSNKLCYSLFLFIKKVITAIFAKVSVAYVGELS